MSEPDKVIMVYDTKLLAPACVLIQAAHGCGTMSEAFGLFKSEHWLTAPTPGMRTIAGTMDEWRKAAKLTSDTWDTAPMRPQEFAQLESG